MLSRRPVRTLKQHACCQLLHMKMLGGGYHTWKGGTLQGSGCDITSESRSLSVLLQSLQMVLGHTQARFHVCGNIIARCCSPKRTGNNKPLCCRSPRWGSPCIASSGTCPAQIVVSFPAERKIAIIFILVHVDRTDSADLGSNSVYLHKRCITPAPLGLAKPKRICLFTVS